MTAPNKPHPIHREVLPPAPVLMGKDQRCSDCNVRSILIANGDLRVCPKCHALLWHADWSAEERAKRAARDAERQTLFAEEKRLRQERQARRHNVEILVEDLEISPPEIGTSTIDEPDEPA